MGDYDNGDEDDQGFVLRLRGLPWSATQPEIMKFFSGIELANGEHSIHFTFSREGRPSGEAFVEFPDEDNLQEGLKKNNEHIGQRYIEVFRSKRSEMDWVVKRAGGGAQTNVKSDSVVRLRGLPFGCSKEEIAQFFTGLEIVPNGIMLPEDRQGRSTGEAYVQFAGQDMVEKALLKHKERIGHRYIEIFKSSLDEGNTSMTGGNRSGVRPLMSGMSGMFGGGGGMGGGGGGGMGRPSPYGRNDRFGGGMGMGGGGGGMGRGGYSRGRGARGNVKGFFEDDYEDFSGSYGGGRGGMRGGRMGGGGGGGMGMGGGPNPRIRGENPGSTYISDTGHSVHMRGLPFQAIEQDVHDFFNPTRPSYVEFEYNHSGRATGEADVDFQSHQDAVEAMKKHKSYMQSRYIELFLNSTPAGNQGGGGGGDAGGYSNNDMSMNNMGGNQGGGYNNMSGGGGGGGGGYNNQGGYGNNMGSGGGGNMGTGNMGGGGGMGGGNMGGGNMGSGNMGGGNMGGSMGGGNMGGGSMGGGSMGGGSMGGGNMGGGNMGSGMGGGNMGGGGGGWGSNSNMGGRAGGANNSYMGNPNYTSF